MEGNLVISPYSMTILFALLESGSRNETKKEIKGTMSLKSSMTDESMSEGVSELIKSMDVSESQLSKLSQMLVGVKQWLPDSVRLNSAMTSFHAILG